MESTGSCVVCDFAQSLCVQSEILHSIKSPKEIPKVVDCEWAGSDRPAIITGNSCLHIMNLDMRHATSPVDNWQLAGTRVNYQQ